MSQQLDGPFKTFTAGEALAAFRRVKMSAANTVMYADAGEPACGVTQQAVANNALVNVKLIAGGVGTFKVTAAGSFAVLARLYGAADGKVDDVASGGSQFTALEAATADGGIVEALALSDVEVEEIGDATLTAAKMIAWKTGAVAVAADALAIPITNRVVNKTTGADAEALTLADGVAGQKLTICLAVDGGGDGTVTPDTCTGFSTIVLRAAGDCVTLQYIDDTVGWVLDDATDDAVVAEHQSFWKAGSVAVAGDELAIPITHRVASKTTGADAEALTLADGVAGQKLTICLAVDGGGDGTLTPTTCTGFTTIVFRSAGDNVTLEFIDATVGWVFVGGTDDAVVAEHQSFWKDGSVAVAADELAIPVTHRVVNKTTGGDGEALTLADGVAGQKLTIVVAAHGGGDGTLTPTTCTGFSTIVFIAAGDNATLEFIDATVGWVIVGAAGVLAPPVISA